MAQANQFTVMRKIEGVIAAAEARRNELLLQRNSHLAAAAQCEAGISEVGRLLDLIETPLASPPSANGAAMFTQPRMASKPKSKKRKRAKPSKKAASITTVASVTASKKSA